VTFGLLPIGLVLIYLGGWFFVATVALVMWLTGLEFVALFRAGGLAPSRRMLIGSSLLLLLTRYLTGFSSAPWVITLIVLAAMTFHLYMYERGQDQAATDFAVTLAGIFYLGWLGSYFVSLRELPGGLYWILLVLPATWIADTGAYLVGSRIGRHKMTPRLSPKKSWEGYWGGVVAAVIGTALLAWAMQLAFGPETGITPLRGAIMGLVMGMVPTLGDLGESMIKRQVGMKDSGTLLPGHGGAFDRIDSWLWAAAVGYYLISAVFLSGILPI
jgi:phosphatidate cytidylyltransferase